MPDGTMPSRLLDGGSNPLGLPDPFDQAMARNAGRPRRGALLPVLATWLLFVGLLVAAGWMGHA